MARQHEPLDLTHGDRVQLRSDGRKGTVIRCRKKDNSGFYFKVKLDDRTWVWPDDICAVSEGRYETRCDDCNIPFRTESPRPGGLCPNCVHHLEGRQGDPGSRTSSWQRRQLRRSSV